MTCTTQVASPPWSLALAGCAPAERRFPLRAPMWQDTDLHAGRRSPATRSRRRRTRTTCPAPRDGTSRRSSGTAPTTCSSGRCRRPSAFVAGRRVGRRQQPGRGPGLLLVHQPHRRAAVPLGQLELGACDAGAAARRDVRRPTARGSSTRAKATARTDGFRVNIPGKGKYLFKADDRPTPEHSSAARRRRRARYHAAGLQHVVRADRLLPAVGCSSSRPGSRWKHNFGDEQAFDRKALDQVLAARPQARRTRPHAGLGLAPRLQPRRLPLRGHARRRSQRRRPARGPARAARRPPARRVARPLRRARSSNTLDTWVARRRETARRVARPRRALPAGHERDCSGSEWDWNEISRRLGYSYIVDWGDIGRRLRHAGHPRAPVGHA